MKSQLIIPNIIDLDEIYWIVQCRFGRNIFFFKKIQPWILIIQGLLSFKIVIESFSLILIITYSCAYFEKKIKLSKNLNFNYIILLNLNFSLQVILYVLYIQ